MSLVFALLGAMRAAFRTRAALALENLALRQQFALLLPSDLPPTVVADSGVENVNNSVDALLNSTKLRRVRAHVEVTWSNSIIEAWWRSLKHQWLYLHSLDSVAGVQKLVAFFVEEHNTKMCRNCVRGSSQCPSRQQC